MTDDDHRRPKEPEGAEAKRDTKAKSGKNRLAVCDKDMSPRQCAAPGRNRRPEDVTNDMHPKEPEKP